MANWSNLKDTVASVIKSNGNQEITGQVLQNVLNTIINNIGANYTFKGLATTTTNPGTPDGYVMYFAGTKGTYTNFGGTTLDGQNLHMFLWHDNAWENVDTGVGLSSSVDESISELYEITSLQSRSIRGLETKIGSDDYKEYNNMGYINKTSGQFSQTSEIYTPYGWHTTDFIPVVEGQVVIYDNWVHDSTTHLACYDSSQRYLRDLSIIGIPAGSVESGTFIVPAGVGFIRATNYNSNYPNPSLAVCTDKLTDLSRELNTKLKNAIDEINNSVDEKMGGFLDFEYSINGYIATSDGQYREYPEGSGWHVTDFIPVVKDVAITYKSYSYGSFTVACYNSNKQFLRDVSLLADADEVTSGTFIVPEGVSFVRSSCYFSKAPERYFRQDNSKFIQLQKELAAGLNLTYDKTLKDNIVYKHFLRMPYNFKGKKLLFCGDSITRGYINGSTTTTEGYPKLFSNLVGATFTNVGVGGATITSTSSYAKILDQVKQYNSSYDVVFIAGGVNDWQAGISMEAFKQAVRTMCSYINANYETTTPVIFIAPINQGGWETTHVINPVDTLQAFRNALTHEVLMNDVHGRFSVVQGSEFIFPTVNDDPDYIAQMFGDKLHPSLEGYKLYAKSLFSVLCAGNQSIIDVVYGVQTEINTLSDSINNSVLPAINGGATEEPYGYDDIASFLGQNNTETTHFWNVDRSKSSTGRVVKIRYKAKEGTTNFFKVTQGSSISSCVFEQIASVTTSSEDNGKIKTIDVDVQLEADQYIGINGALFYAHSDISDNFVYYYIGNAVNSTNKRQIAYEVLYSGHREGLVKDVEALKEKVSKISSSPYEVIVDANGNGNYTTIHDALIGTYGLDSAEHPVTIRVNPGVYNERPMQGVFYPYGYGRHLSIVGTDKAGTIIQSKNSYYYPQVQDGSCIKVAGNVYIANLTLISSDEEYQEPAGTEYTNRHHSYCIHIDSQAWPGDVTEINNCVMINHHNCCIGAGIKEGHTLKIVNCEMKSHLMYKNESYGSATIYAHDANGDTSDPATEHLYIKNCVIESDADLAIKVKSVYQAKIKCSFINNLCTHTGAGQGIEMTSGYVSKTDICFGNNLPQMNN